MKRPFAVIAALIFVLSAFVGCASNKNQENGGSNAMTSNDPATAGKISVKTYVSDGYTKVLTRDPVPKKIKTDHSLYMAKNEKESFNLTVRSSKDIEGLQLVLVEGNTDNLAYEIFDVYGVPAKTTYSLYPEGLVPYRGEFSTKKGVNKTLMVRFSSTENTPSGVHSFKFALKTAEGVMLQEYNITVNVWNFSLPETHYSDAAMQISRKYIAAQEKISEARSGAYYRMYYNMLLDYGVSAYDLPYDILSDSADSYMSNPKITSFCVPWDVSDEKLIQYYEKLSSNEEWLDKAYFYPYDEPRTIEALNVIIERCSHLKELCPKIRIVIPFFKNIDYDASEDGIDILGRYVGIWCPMSWGWTEGQFEDPLNRGYFGDRMAEQKAQGDKVWWYVCSLPGEPYCNLFVTQEGLDHVVLFWQQYLYDVDGLLYWHTNYWNLVDNPWTDSATIKDLTPEICGDGLLFYPGNYVGVDGPVASFRLECVRSGMEDFDLLKKAEELFGREWVVEQVKKVTENLTSRTKSNSVFNDTRKAIGDAIEAKLNK